MSLKLLRKLRNKNFLVLFHHNFQVENFAYFVSEEIPESMVNDFLTILKKKHHFTSKTILRKADDIPENHQEALSDISYLGCALSAVGLTLTILTIILSRYT